MAHYLALAAALGVDIAKAALAAGHAVVRDLVAML